MLESRTSFDESILFYRMGVTEKKKLQIFEYMKNHAEELFSELSVANDKADVRKAWEALLW